MSRIGLQFLRRYASARLPGCFQSCEPHRSEDPVSKACQYNSAPIYSHRLTLRTIRRDDILFRRATQSQSPWSAHIQYPLRAASLLAQFAQAEDIVALRQSHTGVVAHQVTMVIAG